jgi:hypothetical protein
MSELAFLLRLVIVFSGTEPGDVLDQREIYVHPLHPFSPTSLGMGIVHEKETLSQFI